MVAARSMKDLKEVPSGSLVVIEPIFPLDTSSYRFDLALRTVGSGAVALLSYAQTWNGASMTAQQIAQSRDIAIGHLLDHHDTTSVALHLRNLIDDGGQPGLGALELVAKELARTKDLEGIPGMLEGCGSHLAAPLRIAPVRESERGLPIRVAGSVRYHLELGDRTPPAVTTSAAAQIARHIEELYESDYEARELPEVTRSELFNEILLSDSATGADAVARLRQSDFPIDGSHIAIRVDCHEPLPAPSTMRTVVRCQVRVAEILLATMRNRLGQWTQAGTMHSILLISTSERAHSDAIAADTRVALQKAIVEAQEAFPGLNLHVGMGSAHLGVAGFRTSVTEATTAVRAARSRSRANKIEEFDRLGLGRALVRWAEIDGVRPVIDEIMRPLLQQTPRQARDAISTLRAYLDSGRNITKTAAILHLHRNTVNYRIARISELLSVDIEDPDDRLLLDLSCRVAEAEFF